MRAVDLLQAAKDADFGSTYAATAIRGFGINCVEGYLQQLRKTRRRLAMLLGPAVRLRLGLCGAHLRHLDGGENCSTHRIALW